MEKLNVVAKTHTQHKTNIMEYRYNDSLVIKYITLFNVYCVSNAKVVNFNDETRVIALVQLSRLLIHLRG